MVYQIAFQNKKIKNFNVKKEITKKTAVLQAKSPCLPFCVDSAPCLILELIIIKYH